MSKRLVSLILFCLFAAGCVAMAAFAAEGELSPGERLFVRNAASGGMMESKLGQLAQRQGKSQQVKDFGQRMVTEHGGAGAELKDIAARKDVKLPDQIERKHQSMIAKLSRLSGNRFDAKYLQTMVKVHLKEVAWFKRASRKVKDPELNAWAVKTLPMLEQHLQQAKELAQKLGVQ